MVLTHTKKEEQTILLLCTCIKGTKQTLSICPVQRISADILQKAKKFLFELDEWFRRRIRMVFLKR